MDLWIADVFDYAYEIPYIVGIYASEQQAWDAIGIVTTRYAKENPDNNYEDRFHAYVTPVQLNGFTPACMDWLGAKH